MPLSFFPTLARTVFLSYFLIFLQERFALPVDQIGLFVGGFILLSAISSMLLGPLLDHLNLKALMLTASFVQSAVYLCLFMFDSLAMVFILCVLLNQAYLSLETAVRMCIARLFPAEQTAPVLSLKYTFTNTAYALGPLLGLWLNRQGGGLLFCGVSALVFMLIALTPFALPIVVHRRVGQNEGLWTALVVMIKDHSLLKFTLASAIGRRLWPVPHVCGPIPDHSLFCRANVRNHQCGFHHECPGLDSVTIRDWAKGDS